MLKKNSWKLIRICWSKIMFITNMLSKKITLWGGGAMVNDLIPQCGGKEFKSHICNLSHLGYLGDLIRQPKVAKATKPPSLGYLA
jgi:hypothetical protein